MKQVNKILDSINDNVCKYKECKRIQTELKSIGYNCDYGLSGEIYDITKIKYIVWVDSIPNYFNSLKEAIKEKQMWINKGYDNIIIERE